MNTHALLYSSQEDLTIGQLKQGIYDTSLDIYLVEKYLSKHDIGYTVEGNSDFHYKFHQILSKPYIVYYQGDLNLLSKPILGVVGPRKHSDYAKSMVEKCINLAAKYDLVTISGLAPGIDQLAHQLSLTQNIPTIAVLGGGFANFLKSKDHDLIKKIVDAGGLILSEFKLSQKPQTYTYPQRNRIIAGLSDVLFLPEASKKSGSLITVEFAQRQQKPIYGTPNTLSPTSSEGLHEQLQKGLITPIFDFSAMFQKHFSPKTKTSGGGLLSHTSQRDPDTQHILEYFDKTPSLSLPTLLQTGFPQEKIFLSLSRLEMENIIYQPSPGIYSRA